MGDKLIAKQSGGKLRISIFKRQKNRYSDPQYQKSLNPIDHNDLARFFDDLDLQFNSPIEKAFKKYKRKKLAELEDQFFLWENK